MSAPSSDPRGFDRSLDWEEALTGVTAIRKKLATCATGHVLETAVGTGRNFKFFNWDRLVQPHHNDLSIQSNASDTKRTALMTSFTGVDVSLDMLEIAKEKINNQIPSAIYGPPNRLHPSRCTGADGGLFNPCKIRLLKLDSQMVLPPPIMAESDTSPPKYDTVIQSFGLCSINNPDRALEVMASMVKPDTGRIILLEHGRGWPIINGKLDRNAEYHFHRYGCWYNRDIEAIVREAASRVPGLVIVTLKRPLFFQLGTLLWIELKMQTVEP